MQTVESDTATTPQSFPIPVTLLRGYIPMKYEYESVLNLKAMRQKLNDHKEDLNSKHGVHEGRHLFRVQCGELEEFINRQIALNSRHVSIRLVGKNKGNDDYFQFAHVSDEGVVTTLSIHKNCVWQSRQKVASSMRKFRGVLQ